MIMRCNRVLSSLVGRAGDVEDSTPRFKDLVFSKNERKVCNKQDLDFCSLH